MKGVTQAMKTMNRQMNLPQIQQVIMSFNIDIELQTLVLK